MEVAPRYNLLTLMTLLTWFTLLTCLASSLTRSLAVLLISTVDKSIYCYQRLLKFWSHFISRVLSPRGHIKHSHRGYVGLREDVSGPSKGFDAKTSFGLISNHSCLVASCHIVPWWYDEGFYDDIKRISPITISCLREGTKTFDKF